MQNDKLQENIIKWYPFKPNSTILKMTDKLEGIEEQYDYVVIMKLIDDDTKQLIEYAKKYLKENGKILFTINNKLGVKNLCEKTETVDVNKLLNRRHLEELLNVNDLKYYRFFYPLPDVENTNVIFTDEFLPNQETITRNIPLYSKEDFILKPQNEIFLNILEQDAELFKIFSNSYFIECSKQPLEELNIKLIAFSNIRKSEYSIKTIIQGDKVYKTAGNAMSQNHIEQIKANIDKLQELGFKTLDSYEGDTLISQYQQEKQTLDNDIIKLIKEGKKEEAVQLMLQFFQEIREKLENDKSEKNLFDEYNIPYELSDIENLTFIKFGLWDLIFQNAFYINNQFFFYDQEWVEEGIPLEYIYYRSIRYTRDLKKLIDIEQIWKRLGITEQQLKLFEQLDNKLQEKTRDSQIWDRHTQAYTFEKMLGDIETLKAEKQQITDECKKLLNEKDARINFLEENIEQTIELLRKREEQINQIESSTSWKITEPLRKMRKKGENNEDKR